MNSTVYYKILDQKVAHEVIDGEAIVIHFDTGNYYSLNGVAGQIWQWIAGGASREEILEAFEPLTAEQIGSFDTFAEGLVSEELIEKEAGGGESRLEAPLPKTAFEVPEFAKYNDMQNLLLADPIHDVDEKGWPNLPDAE
jgi:hypothetical protein